MWRWCEVIMFPAFGFRWGTELLYIFLIEKILTAKKTNPKADTSEWEKEIDEKVYELYGLTEEEIKMVEESSKKKIISSNKD